MSTNTPVPTGTVTASETRMGNTDMVISVATTAETVGRHTARYGLVFVIVYIGMMKFTTYEAEGIKGLVENSPLLNWTYSFLSVTGFSAVLGAVELVIAGLIAMRPWSAKVSAFGSLLAIGMFLTTLSFLLTTPGVVEPSLGFPAISANPGQFLLKDIVLLGAAVWTFGEALKHVKSRV